MITECRSCGAQELEPVLDLGETPIANALLTAATLAQPEPVFPLRVAFCRSCALLQVTETIPPRVIFGRDYPYYSSSSPQLVRHSRDNVEQLIAARGLGPQSLVIEVASNDGYLLKHFIARNIPVLGVDPAEGPAKAAREAGVPTIIDFFGPALARRLVAEGRRADVLIGNNVLAHVADINGFVSAVAEVLAPGGCAVFEFPYVVEMIDACEFDTIYHEHVFYYSLTALRALFGRHGLRLNDAVPLAIHGGSLRLFVGRHEAQSERLADMLTLERRNGVDRIGYYADFARRVRRAGDGLVALLRELKSRGHRIAAYGAAAKGATLLNYTRLGPAIIDYVVDRNPHKHGKYMPGQHLAIRPPECLLEDQPDFVLLLVWNFADEVLQDQAAYRRRGGRFIIPVPEARIIEPMRGTELAAGE
jgi:SAM-dependent methyltransferase